MLRSLRYERIDHHPLFRQSASTGCACSRPTGKRKAAAASLEDRALGWSVVALPPPGAVVVGCRSQPVKCLLPMISNPDFASRVLPTSLHHCQSTYPTDSTSHLCISTVQSVCCSSGRPPVSTASSCDCDARFWTTLSRSDQPPNLCSPNCLHLGLRSPSSSAPVQPLDLVACTSIDCRSFARATRPPFIFVTFSTTALGYRACD
jgi:hypothetical protein